MIESQVKNLDSTPSLPVVGPARDPKKTNVWNGWTVAAAVVGGIALTALFISYQTTPAGSNEHLPIVPGDRFGCFEDSKELYKFGSPTESRFLRSVEKIVRWASPDPSTNEEGVPACVKSVMTPICKEAIIKECAKRNDTCTDVQIKGAWVERSSPGELFCFANAKMNHCGKTFNHTAEHSTRWVWFPTTVDNGWEDNPVVRSITKFNAGKYSKGRILPENSVLIRSDVDCS